MAWLAAHPRSSASRVMAADNRAQSSSLTENGCMLSYVASSGRLKALGLMPCSQPIMPMYFFALFLIMPLIFSVLTALAAAAVPPPSTTSSNRTRALS